MADGSDVVEYLKEWQERIELGNGEAVNLVPMSDLTYLRTVNEFALCG